MDSNNFNQQPVDQSVQQPAQPPVQPVYYQQPETETPVSVGDWVLTIFLTCIPCVGLILLFVWAFGSSAPKSKSNWAKAELIWVAIGIVLTIILYAAVGATIIGAANSLGGF